MREGEIDPFDLVEKEGSSLRRELIEVDEIFAQNSQQFSSSPRTRATDKSAPDALAKTQQPSGYVPDGAPPAETDRESGEAGGRPGPGIVVGNGQLFLAQPGMYQGEGGDGALLERARPRVRNPKIYHLVDDRGRAQGPLKATDILRLYYKGVLGQGVYVVRRDSKARIPVARFVAALARQQNGEQALHARPGRGHHPGMERSLKRDPVRGARALVSFRPRILGIPTNAVALVVIVAAILLGVAAAWLVLGSGASNRGPLRERGSALRREDLNQDPRRSKSGPDRSSARSSAGNRGLSADDLQDQPKAFQRSGRSAGPGLDRRSQPTRGAVQNGRRSEANGRRLRSPSRPAERKGQSPARFAAKTPPKAEKSLRAPVPSPRSPVPMVRRPFPNVPSQTALSRPVPARPVVVPRPALPAPLPVVPRQPSVQPSPVRAVPPPAPRVAPPPPGNGGQTSFTDGQTVSGIGPFTFDRAAVAKCQAACTVPFKGPMGVVTGKFFKSIWGPILLEKKGPVRLSGLIRKEGAGIKIIVSDIQ